MSSVAEIEAAIKKLTHEEFAQVRNWIATLDAQRWDVQLEADAAAGKLDALGAKAIEDCKNGYCNEL